MSSSAPRFPATRLSVLIDARDSDPAVRARSLEILAQGYWGPVYKHVRLRWRKSEAEAEELTQGFFAAAIERSFFASYDPQKGRFRTFVRVCVDRFVADDQKAERRLKRGGGWKPVSFDAEAAEAELSLVAPDADPDAVFERELKKALFKLALISLRAELTARGQLRHLEAFERYDLAGEEERPSYDELAKVLGVKVTDVTYSLHFARSAFRRHVQERLRELTISEEEYETEATALGLGPSRP
ncbi:MAG: sigma-70 family RNA polymerase sigma factor [Myxococcales bacterium]|nr:sigma-70 family RNA polymerase sigma factor [Myxococcales bacterium]